jgi:nitroreductase
MYLVVCTLTDPNSLLEFLKSRRSIRRFKPEAPPRDLGAVWIQTLRDIEVIRKTLNLPDSAIPVAIIALGYPDENPSPKPRKPLGEIVFLNKYGNKI